MSEPPSDVAAYYKAQPSPRRETLVEMRERILAVLPTASERTRYQTTSATTPTAAPS